MVFSSLGFIFLFLPVTLIGDWIFHKNIVVRNIFLFLLSVLFYAWDEPQFVILLLAMIFINWLLAFLMENVHNGRWCGIIAIFLDVGILICFKYLNWIVEGWNALFNQNISVKEFVLPIGISFYTFQSISYVVDVMRGKAKAEKNPLNVGLYIAFFPQLIAGPIVRFVDIKEQIRERSVSLEIFSEGTIRFLIGFSKKILLADNVAVIVNKAFELLAAGQLDISFAWLGALSYTFQIYFDFSAYSDMAIGLGKMFGFHIPENFNMPYMANSIRDFWRRWHISLSAWFRDYVYITLGGNRVSKKRTCINVGIVWILTGLWHGADLSFLIWGGVYGILVMIEDVLNIESYVGQKSLFKIVYKIFTFVCVMFLWVVFRADNIGVASQYIVSMFGIGQSGGVSNFFMYLSEMKVELAICGVLSFLPIPKEIVQSTGYQSIRPVVAIVLFFISVSYLVKGNFSPFLYFNF